MAAATTPLAGVRVLTLALNLPGPAAAARLTELGAEVTTALPPNGDPVATQLPALFDELHRDQHLETVDMKSEQGQARMETLLAESDVLLTSHRASALQRLGLDFGAVHDRHPRLCQVDIVGFPGARADVPGHDLNYQAEAGLLAGESVPHLLAADMHGAERAVSGVLAGLLLRHSSGEGNHQEIALSDAAVAMALPNRHGLTRQSSSLGGASAFYGVYAAAEGHVAVGALEQHFAQALTQQLNIDPDADIRGQLQRALAACTAAQWQAWGEEHGHPLTALTCLEQPST